MKIIQVPQLEGNNGSNLPGALSSVTPKQSLGTVGGL
jgi:hypothetical protein